mgnify:CR=1 FL=1
MAIQALLVILAVLLVLLFLGVPISYAIAVSSLTAILSSIDLNVAVLTAAQRTFVGMSKFSLTAIPFFILAGNIMNQGGIAKRLVDFVMAILGKLPGALLVTNIGTNALFGAISGSASAAAAAVGSMIRDGAEEQGYDPAVTAATNAASSCSGLLIPPSNALITYSLASGGTSVAALFMAGYIPGIIWALCCCVVGVLLAVKLGYKGTPGKFDWKNLGVCTLRALPSLSLIIVVIGGIVGGICTGIFCVPELSWTDYGGLLYTGDPSLLISQILGIVITIVFVAIATAIIALIVKACFGGSLAVKAADEGQGMDVAQHGESAYPAFDGLD